MFHEKLRPAKNQPNERKKEIATPCTIETRAAVGLSEVDFRINYVAKGRPVIITGAWIPAPDADYKISQQRLEDTYDLMVEFSSAVHSYPANLLLPSRQFRRANSTAYEKEFSLPTYFQENAMTEVCDTRYFQFEWLLLGNKAGGSSFHFDSYNTSAWSVVHSGGRKHWALYPRTAVPPHIRRPRESTQSAKDLSPEQVAAHFTSSIPVHCQLLSVI
jgi:hypothetical protein